MMTGVGTLPSERSGADPHIRALQAGRGAIAAGFATFVALVSHVMAGGQTPGPLGLALPLLFATTACVALGRVSRSWLRLSASVGVSQLLFHALFVLGSAPSTSLRIIEQGEAHAGHGDGSSLMVMSTSGDAAVHAGHGGPWMLLAHAFAALVTVLALHRGEVVLRQLILLASRLASALLRRAAHAVVVPASPRSAPTPAEGTWWPIAVRAMVTCVARRGPPRLQLV